MLMIRFQRIGRTNDPAFRIAVLEKQRAAKSGNIVEQLGTYNPKSKALTLDEERVKHWLSMGAQATGSIHNLLVNKGVIKGAKVNVLPKKTPIVKEVPVVAAPAAAVSAPAAEVAPVAEVAAEVAESLPTEAEVVAEAEPAVEEVSGAEAVVEETPAV